MKAKSKNNQKQNDADIRFIRPSKVQLSRRGSEILIYLGPNIITLHRNFLDAVLNPKKKSS
jgi:hypothetical protein